VRYSKKYPDDMVENLTESPGMCSDGPGSAAIKIPKEGFLFTSRAREKEKDGAMVGFGKKGIGLLT
jgi:hypothetical protein